VADKIILKNISKIYRIPSILPWQPPKKIEALRNVTMSCPEKKITCLLGPNGAGKTTIIKILAGLVLPDSGEISLNGKLPLNPVHHADVRIGIATPNERSFYWRLTGKQNLDFYGSLYGLKGKKRTSLVSDILGEVGLNEDADKPFRLYSSGLRQKLMLARALISDPEILLLDEPASHIDPVSKISIYRLIKENFIKKRGTSILLCTHDLSEAQELADRIVLLDKGSIIAHGTLSALRSKINPEKSVILKFLKMPKAGWEKKVNANIFKSGDLEIQAGIPDESAVNRIVQAAISAGGEIIEVRRDEESLQEIFTRLTGGDQ
jgi:ABC-2 type transport system ATP-binding protein